MKISVLLASYNGERYIYEQIYSILKELRDIDEIIISDDCSTDNTHQIINDISDKRLKMIRGPSLGINMNFLNAYQHSSGDIILLSDQDDIWMSGRINYYLNALKYCDFAFCAAEVIDEKGNTINTSYFLENKTKKSFILNLYKCRTLGCCIGFRKAAVGNNLKFALKYEYLSFDYSLTLLALFYFKCDFSTTPFHRYRRHDNNVSSGGEKSKFSLLEKIRFRLRVINYVIQARNWLPK